MPEPGNGKFAFVRFGKESVDTIRMLDNPASLAPVEISFVCTQVPSGAAHGTTVFIWLGSDSNKGGSTEWKQGLRAVGTLLRTIPPPPHNDRNAEVEVFLKVEAILPESVGKLDILAADPEGYAQNCARMPIVGLNANASQSVQMISGDRIIEGVAQLIRCMVLHTPAALHELRKVPTLVEVMETVGPDIPLVDQCAACILTDYRYKELIPMVAEVLSELASAKVVLIKGPPAVGKTLILTAIAEAFDIGFENFVRLAEGTVEGHGPLLGYRIGGQFYRYPSVEVAKAKRSVVKTAFHMNTKNSDFVCGVRVAQSEQGTKFSWAPGPLFHAMDAAAEGKASLIIIDEINRGPTSAIFGDALIAMDADKREGCPSAFPLTFADKNGKHGKRYVPDTLFIIAAMNEADLSVQAMDLALLRRFSPYDISPQEIVAQKLFNQATERDDGRKDYEQLVAAWAAINARISRLKGHTYQLGHGVFAPVSVRETAEEYAVRVWRRIDNHARELFFNDPSGAASALVADGLVFSANHPWKSPYEIWPSNEALSKNGIRFSVIHSFGPPPRWIPPLVVNACKGAISGK